MTAAAIVREYVLAHPRRPVTAAMVREWARGRQEYKTLETFEQALERVCVPFDGAGAFHPVIVTAAVQDFRQPVLFQTGR